MDCQIHAIPLDLAIQRERALDSRSPDIASAGDVQSTLYYGIAADCQYPSAKLKLRLELDFEFWSLEFEVRSYRRARPARTNPISATAIASASGPIQTGMLSDAERTGAAPGKLPANPGVEGT